MLDYKLIITIFTNTASVLYTLYVIYKNFNIYKVENLSVFLFKVFTKKMSIVRKAALAHDIATVTSVFQRLVNKMVNDGLYDDSERAYITNLIVKLKEIDKTLGG